MTETEKTLLGTMGTCEECGFHEGIYCVDPYYLEIYGIEEVVCLCDDCLSKLVQEI